MLLFQPSQLLTQVPEPLGVLVTKSLRLRSFDSTVRVIEASLIVQTLVHSAEDGGLCPSLWSLEKRPEEQ